MGELIWGFPACPEQDAPGEAQHSDAVLRDDESRGKPYWREAGAAGPTIWLGPQVPLWVWAPWLGLGYYPFSFYLLCVLEVIT